MNYKRKANMALGISVIFFCICIVLRYFYRDMVVFKLMLFVAEASLVGGIADWFAVTALFTKPLGVSYHTEIIPRNRKSIINSTAKLVETDLLSKETLQKQIGNLSVMDKIINYIDNDRDKKSKYIDKLTKMILSYISKKDLSKVTGYIENAIKEKGKNLNLVDKLKDFIEDKFIYENRVEWAQSFLSKLSTEEGKKKLLVLSQKILDSNDESSSFSLNSLFKKLNISVAEDLADVINTQLQKILKSLIEENSELSRVCVNNIIKSIDSIEFSPASIEEWKNDILEKTDFKLVIDSQFSVVINEKTISDILEKLWDYFKGNSGFKNVIDKNIREVIYNVLEKKHKVIGNIASDTLNSFTDEKLNEFIEEKAGEDLQWIRINGSVLGGCIGLVLFVFLNLIFEPYVSPIIRGLL